MAAVLILRLAACILSVALVLEAGAYGPFGPPKNCVQCQPYQSGCDGTVIEATECGGWKPKYCTTVTRSRSNSNETEISRYCSRKNENRCEGDEHDKMCYTSCKFGACSEE